MPGGIKGTKREHPLTRREKTRRSVLKSSLRSWDSNAVFASPHNTSCSKTALPPIDSPPMSMPAQNLMACSIFILAWWDSRVLYLRVWSLFWQRLLVSHMSYGWILHYNLLGHYLFIPQARQQQRRYSMALPESRPSDRIPGCRDRRPAVRLG